LEKNRGHNLILKMRLLFFLCIILMLASCKTQNLLVQKNGTNPKHAALDSTFFYNPGYEHVIRKDDKVSISVWGQDELSVGSVYGIYNSNEVYGKWLLVDQRGNIELPKFGSFKAEGFTIPQMKDSLRNIYQKWIVNPVVDVKILNKEITVLGEVRNPTVVPVDKDRNTLLEMISKTGGFEFYANLKYVKVLRQEGEHVRVANIDLTHGGNYLAKNIQLHPGDIVIVPSKRYKTFDKRISTIIPFTSTVTAAAILMGTF
jgi:polysaccharide biosynthesis/export protein